MAIYSESIIALVNATPISLILSSIIIGIAIRSNHRISSNIFLLLALGMIGSIGTAKFIKAITGRYLPKWLTSRPSKNNRECSNFGTCKTSATSYTSAHATAMGFFAMFLTVISTDFFKEPLHADNWAPIVITWTLSASVASERVYIGCHNTPQILAGIILGSGLACGYYKIVRRWVTC